MNNELTPLEALNNIRKLVNDIQYASKIPSIDNELVIIEKALKRLEKIDLYFKVDIDNKFHNYIDLTTIDKKLKALEIIKKKKVDVLYFCTCRTLREYNAKTFIKIQQLTQEEFDLLKEVLK